MVTRQYFPCLLLFSFLVLLISSSKLSSTLVMAKHGERNEASLGNTFESVEPIDELTGLEKCGKDDEECSKRRLISEAHLDYIYTQKQQNP